jgi:hypothetical protein
MLVVKIELWRHGDPKQVTEVGRMYIANNGTGTADLGSYEAAVCRRGTSKVPQPISPSGPKATRSGRVDAYPRRSYNVWRLIARALLSAFPEERETIIALSRMSHVEQTVASEDNDGCA